jgi:hypothetical protein
MDLKTHKRIFKKTGVFFKAFIYNTSELDLSDLTGQSVNVVQFGKVNKYFPDPNLCLHLTEPQKKILNGSKNPLIDIFFVYEKFINNIKILRNLNGI